MTRGVEKERSAVKAPDFESNASDARSPRLDIDILHERCGIYTKRLMVDRILDSVGWTDQADLLSSRLLEPSAGDGAFVVEAATRLLKRSKSSGQEPSLEILGDRIRSFELHPIEARKAHAGVVAVLLKWNLAKDVAEKLADSWVTSGDFLLSVLEPNAFTHVVGNPPYSRWSKIPDSLREKYEATLPKSIAKGDIFLPFLDRGLEALKPGGKLGFLCSDRWRYMAFAKDFRRERLPQVEILVNEEVAADDVYRDQVDIYPSVIVMERLAHSKPLQPTRRSGQTLDELGFDVRVGPALGCTPAYVLTKPDTQRVEPELLTPWVDASGVTEGRLILDGRRVICLWDDEGNLRDLTKFPLAAAWLEQFRAKLENRAVVTKSGAVWYRPIDKVQADRWKMPKLLLPELAKIPRIALDLSGAIPSHGVYAIVPRNPMVDIDRLASALANGGLAKALEGRAPKVKGSYVRCYKSILSNIIVDQ